MDGMQTATLLAAPNPGADLEQLARELNELAKIRQTARLAFCMRLAAAYLLIVGHAPNQRSKDGQKFRDWCDAKIHAANGKRYSHRTLELYLIIGFSNNPAKIIQARMDDANRRAQDMRRLGAALSQAASGKIPNGRVIPVVPLQARAKGAELNSDVAQEVNALMTAWEAASSEARRQFLYLVSGRRVG